MQSIFNKEGDKTSQAPSICLCSPADSAGNLFEREQGNEGTRQQGERQNRHKGTKAQTHKAGNSRLRVESRLSALGLWLAALGILIQAATGAKGYLKVPPGIIILMLGGFVLYKWGRLRIPAFVGLFLAALVSAGVFVTEGTGYRLSRPFETGPFVGTVIQLAGLILALLYGIRNLRSALKRKQQN